ncbi:hypothetical protein RLK21_00685, partial [Streptococcus pneumoniae]|nr:hypothetical protein [Streptococcus pneumoniae]
TGKNFAAGMSGGVAYILDEDETFSARCNPEMVHMQPLADPSEIAELKEMVENHVRYTGSLNGKRVLDHWEILSAKFV